MEMMILSMLKSIVLCRSQITSLRNSIPMCVIRAARVLIIITYLVYFKFGTIYCHFLMFFFSSVGSLQVPPGLATSVRFVLARWAYEWRVVAEFLCTALFVLILRLDDDDCFESHRCFKYVRLRVKISRCVGGYIFVELLLSYHIALWTLVCRTPNSCITRVTEIILTCLRFL